MERDINYKPNSTRYKLITIGGILDIIIGLVFSFPVLVNIGISLLYLIAFILIQQRATGKRIHENRSILYLENKFLKGIIIFGAMLFFVSILSHSASLQFLGLIIMLIPLFVTEYVSSKNRRKENDALVPS